MVFFNLSAQELSPILFIYDGSGSMWGALDGQTKKEIAADVLSTTIGQLADEQQIGLIAYGHRTKGDCDDIEYLVDLNNQSKELVTQSVKKINPTGKTPLARSLRLAIDDLAKNNIQATIILITDGIESCDGDLCRTVQEAKSNGISFKLHIVGFGLKEGEDKALRCAAEAGDGLFFDAQGTQELSDVLGEATSKTIDDPVENVYIYTYKNNEPIDATVQPVGDKSLDAARTYGDTAKIYLPPGNYTLAITPLENTDLKSTTITVDVAEDTTIYREISFDAGNIFLTTTNNGEPHDVLVHIKDPITDKTIAQTRTYGNRKEVVVPPGEYNVQFSSIKLSGTQKISGYKKVNVEPSGDIEAAHDFKSGIAKIGVQSASNVLIDATVFIIDKSTGKQATGSRTYTSDKTNPRTFLLTPAIYEVRVSGVNSSKEYKDKKTTFDMEIKAGQEFFKMITF